MESNGRYFHSVNGNHSSTAVALSQKSDAWAKTGFGVHTSFCAFWQGAKNVNRRIGEFFGKMAALTRGGGLSENPKMLPYAVPLGVFWHNMLCLDTMSWTDSGRTDSHAKGGVTWRARK